MNTLADNDIAIELPTDEREIRAVREVIKRIDDPNMGAYAKMLAAFVCNNLIKELETRIDNQPLPF